MKVTVMPIVTWSLATLTGITILDQSRCRSKRNKGIIHQLTIDGLETQTGITILYQSGLGSKRYEGLIHQLPLDHLQLKQGLQFWIVLVVKAMKA